MSKGEYGLEEKRKLGVGEPGTLIRLQNSSETIFRKKVKPIFTRLGWLSRMI